MHVVKKPCNCIRPLHRLLKLCNSTTRVHSLQGSYGTFSYIFPFFIFFFDFITDALFPIHSTRWKLPGVNVDNILIVRSASLHLVTRAAPERTRVLHPILTYNELDCCALKRTDVFRHVWRCCSPLQVTSVSNYCYSTSSLPISLS